MLRHFNRGAHSHGLLVLDIGAIVTVRIKMMTRLHKWLSHVIIVLLAMMLLIVFFPYHIITSFCDLIHV